jgi:hypothetical protein
VLYNNNNNGFRLTTTSHQTYLHHPLASRLCRCAVSMGVVSEPNVDWTQDEYWRTRRISPAQLLIHDISLEQWRPLTAESSRRAEPMLEATPILSSSLLPVLANRDVLAETLPIQDLTPNRQEQTRLKGLVSEYGWLNCLRINDVQESHDDPPNLKKLRWM